MRMVKVRPRRTRLHLSRRQRGWWWHRQPRIRSTDGQGSKSLCQVHEPVISFTGRVPFLFILLSLYVLLYLARPVHLFRLHPRRLVSALIFSHSLVLSSRVPSSPSSRVFKVTDRCTSIKHHLSHPPILSTLSPCLSSLSSLSHSSSTKQSQASCMHAPTDPHHLQLQPWPSFTLPKDMRISFADMTGKQQYRQSTPYKAVSSTATPSRRDSLTPTDSRRASILDFLFHLLYFQLALFVISIGSAYRLSTVGGSSYLATLRAAWGSWKLLIDDL